MNEKDKTTNDRIENHVFVVIVFKFFSSFFVSNCVDDKYVCDNAEQTNGYDEND